MTLQHKSIAEKPLVCQHFLKRFFALDLYDKIVFKASIKAGDKNYKKYADKDARIDIGDILNDLKGNWEYSGGIGKNIF